MNFTVNIPQHSISLYYGKDLEYKIDDIAIYIQKIIDVEIINKHIYLIFEDNCIQDEDNIQMIDPVTNSTFYLTKIANARDNCNLKTFYLKEIKSNCFSRKFEREQLKNNQILLKFKNSYGEYSTKEVIGNDISTGGISFFINSDDSINISEYIAIFHPYKNEFVGIELKNIKIFSDNRIIVGTKFINKKIREAI